MLKRIDAHLLAQTQKFTDWTQTWFGLTKFRLEKWALILCWMILTIGAIAHRFWFSATLAIVVFGTITVYVAWCIEKEEGAFLSRGELKFVESHKRRTVLVTMGVLIAFEAISFQDPFLLAGPH